MDFDLNSRFSKVEKDQQKRREEAKRKLHVEKKRQEEHIIRDRIWAEEARVRKEEEERKKEEMIAKEQEEMLETDGIRVFVQNLIPYEIDGNDDKVILSEDVLNQLMTQDAYSKGPMYFKIIANLRNKQTGEIITTQSHVGVREFTAEKSCIGLPRKVLDSVVISHEIFDITTVSIKYVRLPKCTYVKLQPKANDFFNVGPVKLCLEENFRLHSTLTLGDILTVWYRGKGHVLKVVDMKPENRGSLIDSDVEVDLELSEEFSKMQQSSIESSSSVVVSNESIVSSSSSSLLTNKGFHRLTDSNIPSSSSSSSFSIPSITSSSIVIPPEPELSAIDAIAIKIKTPNVGTIVRRFTQSNNLSSLFHLVSQAMKEDVNRIQLSTRFPPRTLTYQSVITSDETYEKLGLKSQETFMASLVDKTS